MRYLPLTDTDREDMLARIGVPDIDALFSDVPAGKLLKGPVDLPRARGELEVERILGKMAGKNTAASAVPFFVGAGAYKHHVPATVDHLIQRSEFLTSYTPYQPEIAQGTLQYLFEFQTQVAALTGMEVANASMYDGSTGTGEAVLMAHRVTKRRKAVLSGGLHPHYTAVVETLSEMANDEVVALKPDVSANEDILSQIDDSVSCVVVQSPDVFGNLRDLKPIAEKAHAHGALLIAVFTEVVSLGAVVPPGAQDADIVVGEGQSIGNALNFGGPYVGLFAAKSKYIRQMPGRLCGETVNSTGQRGFVLTLSTREQHIRRDKATSNICTNSGLCVLAFDDEWLKGSGVSTLDFAKAMIDEGYHPMTVYFPLVVHGAMLIEPTESESKAALDLFIATLRDLAMAAKGNDKERFTSAPHHAPIRRLDETRAARSPVLKWEKPAPAKAAE
ncbi:glycine dehydrogenase (decarboxylating) subunit 1 [Bosea thiooxidans]